MIASKSCATPREIHLKPRTSGNERNPLQRNETKKVSVSRLLSALRGKQASLPPLIVVTVFDKAEAAASFAMVQELRAAGLRADAYVGNGKMGDQFKYADKRGAVIAVIEGGDERARGEVTLKDLALGAELAKSVESRAELVRR